MNKILVIALCVMVMASNVLAQVVDIAEEVTPTVSKANVKEIRIMPESKTVEVTMSKGYVVNVLDEQENIVGTEFVPIDRNYTITLRNIDDDPETTDVDETDKQYTNFMKELNIPNLKTLIQSKA